MMKNKTVYEKICFEIISAAGTAKSCYLEAVEHAKNKEDYESVIKEGNAAFIQAADAHSTALQLDADESLDTGLLLIHAETILSSAETVRDLTTYIIQLLAN